MSHTTDSRVFNELVRENTGAKKILAEGDSWFAYPRQFLFFGEDSNIIDHLSDKDNLIIYNTSNNGDEVVAMVSGKQKLSLIKKLAHNNFDILLFSGGGNDIVGRYDFDFFIRKKKPEMEWRECIIDSRVNLKLEQIRRTYEILCELVIEYSANKNIRIVAHTYDIATPMETGFELFDLIPMGKSWMYPYLVRNDIIDATEQRNIVHHLLSSFKDTLLQVQNNYPILRIVDTQGTLTSKEQWRNEIHPTPEGFGLIADKIYDQGIKS